MGEQKVNFLLELKGKRIVVMGMGITGKAVASFLKGKCRELVLTDSQKVDDFDSGDIQVELGGHRKETFENCDLLIVSPGIPSNNFFIDTALSTGAEVISEIELAWKLSDVPLISITGTNGKTTTLTLLAEILENSGFKISVGGNIGRPLIDAVQDQTNDLDFILSEISSFQLELSPSIRPYLSMITNVTHDHIGRHKSIEDYLEVKTKLLSNQKECDVKVINADDPITRYLEFEGSQKTLAFSRKKKVRKGAFVKDEKIFVALEGRVKEVCSVAEMNLQGLHNLENFLGACAAGFFLGADLVAMRHTATSFQGLPHRMELILKEDGITWINDSKATNVGATKMSILSFERDIFLIAGGFDKNSELESILPVVKSRVKKMFLIGEAAKRFNEFFKNEVETEIVSNLETAVSVISSEATSGQVVLFSPACSSFDQFDDYIDRGNCFRELVHRSKEIS